MSFTLSSLKKRMISAFVSVAMFFNATAFPIEVDSIEEQKKTIYGMELEWNEQEQLWQTPENTDVFGSYTFTAYWDPREKTRDLFWDATNGNNINSQEVKIVFTFNSSDTSREWKVSSGGSGNTPSENTTDKYNSNPDFWLEIPGIASAKRDEKQKPLVGNDSKSIVCDAYDLANDKAVYELKENIRNLNGGMEIVWKYNPRELTSGYGLTENGNLTDAIGNTYKYDESQTLHPCAYVKVYDNTGNYDLVKVRMSEMHFGFVSERDNIFIDLNESKQDELDSGSLDTGHYSWKCIHTDFYTYAKTRPMTDTQFYVEVKAEDVEEFTYTETIPDPENPEQTIEVTHNGADSVYMNIAGQYHKLSDYTAVDGFYRIPVDYDKVLEWSKNADVGTSGTTPSVDVYIGVEKDIIRKRAELQFESDETPEIVELRNNIKEIEDIPEANRTDEQKTNLADWNTQKTNIINQYIVTTTTDEHGNTVETLNYTIDVTSRIVREYADEEGTNVDYDIPQNEQGTIISNTIKIEDVDGQTDKDTTADKYYPDTHIDTAAFGFRDDPHYGDGGITVSKWSGEPLRTSSDMASGDNETFKVGVSSKNMETAYDVTIKDDKLIVLLDDGKTDYNNAGTDGTIIQDFSYKYSNDKPNSKYRELQPDEYNFVELVIPEYKNYIGISQTEKTFDYNVILTKYDTDTKITTTEPLETTYNTNQSQTIDLTGKNVIAIEIKLHNVEGSLKNFTPEFKVKFNLKSDATHAEYRSGTGNELSKDPYGKLINFALAFAEQTDENQNTNYYGETKDNANPPDRYNGYVAKDENLTKFVYKDNSTPYESGGELLQTKNVNGKNYYIYAARSDAGLTIRDPAVDVTTTTSYRKVDGAVIDLEQTKIDGTEAKVKTAGKFYTELTSKLEMKPTEDTSFNKLVIKTVMPKVLADANGLTGSSYLSLSNVKINNIKLVENGTSKTLTAEDLIPYYNRSNTHTSVVYNKEGKAGQDYVEIITELDFSDNGAYIQIDKGITGNISLTYPLYMNYTTESNWKNQIDVAQFYGATVATITPSSPVTINGNKAGGINGTISDYYNPNTSDIDVSSTDTNSLPTSATSWNENSLKYVRSDLNKGSLDAPGTFGKSAEVNMWQENQNDAEKKMADYEYRYYFQMGNSYASRLFIYDNVEEAEDFDTVLNETVIPSESKWHGTLKNVVVEGPETNLNHEDSGHTKLVATVFYATNKIDPDLYLNEKEYEAIQRPKEITDATGTRIISADDTRNTPETDGIDSEGNKITLSWIPANSYTGEMSDVKAFCVMVTAIDTTNNTPVNIAKSQDVYFTVQMTAPQKTTEETNSSILNTDTYNKFTVRYARLDANGERDENFEKSYPNYPINSDNTTVTLRDTILKLTIVKTDFERPNKWNNNTNYMLISGAKFKIYECDENGVKKSETAVQNKVTGNDYFETDEYGEISVNLAQGWYYLEEIESPNGYRVAKDVLFHVNAVKNKTGDDIEKYNLGEEILNDLKVKQTDGSFVAFNENDPNRNVFLKYTGKEEVYSETTNNVTEVVSMDTLQLEIADEIVPGKVEITKYDETYKNVMTSLGVSEYTPKTVPNVTYRLYKANGTQLGDPVYVTQKSGYYECAESSASPATMYLTTDENGKIIITELPWGTFYLVEQSAPVGYEVPDTTDKSKYVSFSVSPDMDRTEYNETEYIKVDDVSAWDKETGLSIELHKYDLDDNSKISNAEFNLEIWNPEGGETKTGAWENWDAYSNKITKNGSITFTNGNLPILALGTKYRIKEINSASDYKKATEENPLYSIEFDFTASGFEDKIEIKDGIKTETIVSEKTENGITTKIVTIQKREHNNNTDGNILSKNSLTLTTDINNRTIKADVNMYNERKQSTLTIFKTDKDGNALGGAAFALYEVVGNPDKLNLKNGKLQFDLNGGVERLVGENVDENTPDTPDKLIMSRQVTKYSGEDQGTISIPNELEWDKTYYLVEMTAPKGYQQTITDTPETFKLREEINKPASDTKLVHISSSGDNIKLQWNANNEQIPGSVTLRKFAGDEKGNKTKTGDNYDMLAGAKFKLVDNKGEIVKNTETDPDKSIKVTKFDESQNKEVTTVLGKDALLDDNILITDKNGEIKIENLPWGRGYELIETEAPAGYDIVKIKKFSIDANHTHIEKEAVDPVKTTSLRIWKSVDKWKEAFGDATFIFKVKEMDETETSYTGKEFTEMITINQEDVSDGNGRKRDYVSFYNLDATKKYEVTEILVARYTLDDIICPNGSTATIEKDNTTYQTTRKCIVSLRADDKENNIIANNEIEYKNNLTYYDKFSENKTEPNLIDKQQMITGVNFRVDTSKLDPDTLGLKQPSLSDKYYDFFPKTNEIATMKDENGNTVNVKDANGNDVYKLSKNTDGSYRSDALVVTIYPDKVSDGESVDTGVRIYPQGHEKYDPTVGYYELLNHVGATNDEDAGVEYVKDGKVYYLSSPRDEELQIRVVLPDTSQYSWATQRQTDTDLIHIDLADAPKPITFKFHYFDIENTMPAESGAYRPVQIGENTISEPASATYDIKFTYNSTTGVYTPNKALTVPVVKGTGANFAFSYWYKDKNGEDDEILEYKNLDDFMDAYVCSFTENTNGEYVKDATTGNYRFATDSAEDQTATKYVVTYKQNTGTETNIDFYPRYVQGRAMFNRTKMEKVFQYTNNGNISYTKIVQLPSKPSWADNTTLVSESSNAYPLNIWAKIEGVNGQNIAYWYSQDSTPFTPTNMKYMFQNQKILTDIAGVYNWDTTYTTQMKYCFNHCESLKSANLENWNTSSVNGTGNEDGFIGMLEDCRELEEVKMTFNTSGKNVRTDYLLNRCYALRNVTIIGDMSGVSDARQMFCDDYLLSNLTLRHISMELGEPSNLLTESGSNKAFSNCSSMNRMFANCKVLTDIDCENWDTSKVTNMEYTFNNCYNLSHLNVSKWDTHSATTFLGMFERCYKLGGIEMTLNTKGKSVDTKYMFSLEPNGGYSGEVYSESEATADGSGNKTSKIVLHGDLSGVNNAQNIFNKNNNIKEIIIDQRNMTAGIDSTTYGSYNINYESFANCTIMSNMFQSCNAITKLDVSMFNTVKVTQMNNMLSGCSKLEEIIGLYKFNTTSCYTMQNMFNGCSKLSKLDLSSFSIGDSLCLRDTFKGCSNLERIYANPAEWPHRERDTTAAYLNGTFGGCSTKLKTTLGISVDSGSVKMAVVNGATYVAEKGGYCSSANGVYDGVYETTTDSNGNTVYVGYFTSYLADSYKTDFPDGYAYHFPSNNSGE